MSNNTPDYENNLAFEPEFTWEDLVKWAKEFAENKKLSIKLKEKNIVIDTVSLWRQGFVYSVDGMCLNVQRNPRQMQTVIKALYE